MAKQTAEKKHLEKKTSTGSSLSKILYPLLITISFVVVFMYIFDAKINLGGDNAGYYILGKAISSGQGYSDIHMPDNPPHTHFPPGYPAILAFFMKLFSEDISFLKVVSGLFLWGSVLVMFYLLKNIVRDGRMAFVGAILMLFNMHLLSYSTIMMSEIPFLFFSLLILLLFIKTSEQENPFKHPHLYFVIVLSAFAYHVRTAGIALVGGIILYLLFRKRFAYLGAYVGGFALLCLPWFLRGRSLNANGYINQLFMKNPYRPEEGMMGLSDFFSRFLENLGRYLGREIPNGLFPSISVNYQADLETSSVLFGLALLALIVFGIVKLPLYRNLFIWYCLGTFGILLLWPEVWFGIRFLLPLIPILTFLLVYGVYHLVVFVLKKLTLEVKPNPIILLLAILLFLPQLKLLHAAADKRYDSRFQNYFDMASWVRENTDPYAVISCRKPTLFYLFANRKTAGYLNSTDYNAFILNLNSNGVTHVVIDGLGFSSTGRYLVPVIQTNPYRFKTLLSYQNPETYLLTYNKDVGYIGEWRSQGAGKMSVKEGKGTFTYENGNVFKGTWVNNLREGVGTMYYPDGNKVVARYEADRIVEILDAPDSTGVE
jgi:hypothetical protein